jgi:hypothetical protein
MLTTSDILCGVVLPLVLSGVILVATSLTKGRHLWAGPLAIGAGYSIGFGCIEGIGHLFPPASAVPWLFHLGLLFTLVGLLDSAVRMPTWLRVLVIFVATVLGTGLLLRFNFINQTWDALHGAAWLIAIAIVATIWWCCFEYASVEPRILMPLGAMFITGIPGLVVMLVADQTVGQALGALATSLAAAAGVVGWFKQVSLARGTAVVISGVGVCALAAAYFVSGVPIADLSLIAITPLLLAAGRWLPGAKRRPWLHFAIRLSIVLVPLGVALALAVRQFQREAVEKSSDAYSVAPHSRCGGQTVFV